MAHPALFQTVLDTTDPRGLAEFYRQLLGLSYRPGDEVPRDGEDWLVLVDDRGSRALAFQLVAELPRPTWPDPAVPQQLHLDMTVPSIEELEQVRADAERLGATLLEDRSHDPDEPLYVLADPAGHPFCVFVP